jgi:hypothetical protein
VAKAGARDLGIQDGYVRDPFGPGQTELGRCRRKWETVGNRPGAGERNGRAPVFFWQYKP